MVLVLFVLIISAATLHDVIKDYLKQRKALKKEVPVQNASESVELGATNMVYEGYKESNVNGAATVSEVDLTSYNIQPESKGGW